jgi:hypothetical protein
MFKFLFFFLFCFYFCNAQTDIKKPIDFSCYLETYYSYDVNKPRNHNKPNFIYSHNRHNEINLNLGFVKAVYQKETVRSTFTIATGTYMNANYSSEPGLLKNIYEGNIGFKISKKTNTWLDIGILPSHIGFESAISKDCPTLTRSLLADNSPYFETGIKITHISKNEKWLVSGLLLNGWQRIQRVDGNNTPALGHQLTYKPTTKVTLNSSSFIGNDKPDSARQMRYFHNFYGTYALSKRIHLTTGFDIGAEQKFKKSATYNYWYSPVIILKYMANNKVTLALRSEYYQDANAVIITTGTTNGFKTLGVSANFDYNINENMQWRVELKNLKSKDKIFNTSNNMKNTNFCATTSLAISF